MKLEIPTSIDPVGRVTVSTAAGVLFEQEQQMPFPSPHEIALPDGVSEDDVEVVFVGIGNNNKPSGEPVIVKKAGDRAAKAAAEEAAEKAAAEKAAAEKAWVAAEEAELAALEAAEKAAAEQRASEMLDKSGEAPVEPTANPVQTSADEPKQDPSHPRKRSQ